MTPEQHGAALTADWSPGRAPSEDRERGDGPRSAQPEAPPHMRDSGRAIADGAWTASVRHDDAISGYVLRLSPKVAFDRTRRDEAQLRPFRAITRPGLTRTP